MHIDIPGKNLMNGSHNHNQGLYIPIQEKVTTNVNTTPPLFWNIWYIYISILNLITVC